MIRIIFGLVFLGFVFQGCGKSKASEIQIITADEVIVHKQYNSEEKSEIKDEEDFEKSRLVNGEKLLAIKSFRADLKKLEKESPIAIYFTSENRTQETAKILSDLGFKQIYILDGGIKKWSNAK